MKVLVCGDAMIDLYWFGDVHRISPEAPVPVVKLVRTEERAGAAANVARNCKAMGAEQVTLVSICGQDQRGDTLQALLENDGIDFIPCMSLVTTQKLRVIGRSQQVVRIDTDPYIAESAVEALQRSFAEQVGHHDIVVFSDYGKGALGGIRGLIVAAKKAGARVLVDPKGYDYERYAGADVVKPNLDELRELVGGWHGEYELEQKARKLRVEAGVGAVLLTRAADGMTLYTEVGTTSIASEAREVYDVSGAGDTAIAALACALGRGMALERAAAYANKAAGIVCGRFGTSIAEEHEVFDADPELTAAMRAW